MLTQLQSNIAKNNLFNKNHHLLLAVSGGVDSVVLAHLLKEGGYNFSMAHCNFNLRGKDSIADEKFCRNLAVDLEVKIFVKQANVKKYCAQTGLSVQMAAREIRYTWFEELLKKQKFDFLLTAHHANDNAETVFINLLRGTGIAGLKGIPRKNGKTIRPLLNFTREEIETYAKKHKIKFRTDKSNFEDKYERNFIRNKIIPALKKINPSLEQTFLKNSPRFQKESAVIAEYITNRIAELVSVKKDAQVIARSKFRNEKHAETFLHYWLSPFNFTETQQQNILEAALSDSSERKHFLTAGYKLVISRDEISLLRVKEAVKEIKINSLAELKQFPLLSFSKEKKFFLPAKNELYLNPGQLHFPLSIRPYKTGEKFKPFGMKGFKLLSDFYKDIKISDVEKEKSRVLVNGNNEIIWVIGYRSDERYRVDPAGKNFFKLAAVE